uniref:Uncharacterized protein n=1 Tax=Rhizophora mucronata TaxID=61149 RepID=A0A2P2N918_RHIMU
MKMTERRISSFDGISIFSKITLSCLKGSSFAVFLFLLFKCCNKGIPVPLIDSEFPGFESSCGLNVISFRYSPYKKCWPILCALQET